MNATLNATLADLETIGLDDLNERAAMLTRVDRKYALDAATASSVLSRLPEDTRVLQIAGQVSQCYASTYYDTPDMDSYLLTALKRRRRFKVRARTYLSTGASFLEVKTRGPRGLTVKKRMSISWDEAGAPSCVRAHEGVVSRRGMRGRNGRCPGRRCRRGGWRRRVRGRAGRSRPRSRARGGA